MSNQQYNLYRKYRPQTFDDVWGQERVVAALQKAAKEKTPSHSYLFSGTRGVGKTTLARIFAKELGVSERDLHEIDAASHTSVEDIREIRDAVHVLPFNSPYKVYLLDEAHMLSKSAFNALLKTLEEPPAHVIFMLATTEPEKLPETIISRCEHYQLKPPTVPVLRDFVRDIAKKEGYDLGASAAELVARFAQGSFRDALSLLQKVLLAADDTVIAPETVSHILDAPSLDLLGALLEAVVDADVSRAMQYIQQAAQEGSQLLTLYDLLLERLRAVLLLQVDPNADLSAQFNEEEQKLLQALAAKKRLRAAHLLHFLQQRELLATVPQTQLAFELTLLSYFETYAQVAEKNTLPDSARRK